MQKKQKSNKKNLENNSDDTALAIRDIDDDRIASLDSDRSKAAEKVVTFEHRPFAAETKHTKEVSREKQGITTGIVGLALNILLGVGKLIVGLMSGSVSITSDAANNLSDAGNSMVTVSSFFLGGRKADKEHPYGHGRYEYIASLLIGLIILMVGFEFGISAVKKIISPSVVTLGALTIVVLAVSIAVKLFMFLFYTIKNKKINSGALKAAALDSFSDCLVTCAVIAGVLLTKVLPPFVDGIIGLVVSAVIIFGGGKLIMETINRLLGKNCDEDLAKKIVAVVCSNALVVGAHDLRVHDYGPEHTLASVHAEFDRNISITEAHNVIDALEHKAYYELGIELVVHCDPIDTSDLVLNRVRHTIKDVIRVYDGSTIHDLDIDYNEKVVAFHLKIREKHIKERDRIIEVLTDAIGDIVPKFSVIVEIDVVYD